MYASHRFYRVRRAPFNRRLSHIMMASLFFIGCASYFSGMSSTEASPSSADTRWSGRVALDAAHWRLHANGQLASEEHIVELGFAPSRVGVSPCADKSGGWLAVPSGMSSSGPGQVRLVRHRRGESPKVEDSLTFTLPLISRPAVSRNAEGMCRWLLFAGSGNIWLWTPGATPRLLDHVEPPIDYNEQHRGTMSTATQQWALVADGSHTLRAWPMRSGKVRTLPLASPPQPGVVWQGETVWWVSLAGDLHRWDLRINAHTIEHKGSIAVRTGLTAWAEPDGVARRVAWGDLEGGIWTYANGVTKRIGMTTGALLWPFVSAPIGSSSQHVLLGVVEDGSVVRVDVETPMWLPNGVRAVREIGVDEDLSYRPTLLIPQVDGSKALKLSADEGRATSVFVTGSSPWSGQQMRDGALRDVVQVDFTTPIKPTAFAKPTAAVASSGAASKDHVSTTGGGCSAGSHDTSGHSRRTAPLLFLICAAFVAVGRRRYRKS